MQGRVIVSSFKALAHFLAWFWAPVTSALQGNTWTRVQKEGSWVTLWNGDSWKFIYRQIIRIHELVLATVFRLAFLFHLTYYL